MIVIIRSTQEAINALVMLEKISHPGDIISVLCDDRITQAAIGGLYMREYGGRFEAAGAARRIYTDRQVLLDFKSEEDIKWPTHTIIFQ